MREDKAVGQTMRTGFPRTFLGVSLQDRMTNEYIRGVLLPENILK
jgi:hypothetical protein